jgi:hypothetical protein
VFNGTEPPTPKVSSWPQRRKKHSRFRGDLGHFVSRFALRSLDVLGEHFHCVGGNVSLFKGLHHKFHDPHGIELLASQCEVSRDHADHLAPGGQSVKREEGEPQGADFWGSLGIGGSLEERCCLVIDSLVLGASLEGCRCGDDPSSVREYRRFG